jgi:hypothetical protein
MKDFISYPQVDLRGDRRIGLEMKVYSAIFNRLRTEGIGN